jgi:hypothetical protein
MTASERMILGLESTQATTHPPGTGVSGLRGFASLAMVATLALGCAGGVPAADQPSERDDQPRAAPPSEPVRPPPTTPEPMDPVDPEPPTTPDERVRISALAQIDQVTAAQMLLRLLGWDIEIDGQFGPLTRRALREFQHANGMTDRSEVAASVIGSLADPDAAGIDEYLADPIPRPVDVPSPDATPAPRVADPELLAVVEAEADRVGFDWRARGVTFRIGCSDLQEVCASGSYETASRIIHISRPTALHASFRHYVILHELAHAWQFTVRGWPQAADDASDWGESGLSGLDAAADCLSLAWGAPRQHAFYWDCPSDARAHMLALYVNSGN